jgi:hypothetical protein
MAKKVGRDNQGGHLGAALLWLVIGWAVWRFAGYRHGIFTGGRDLRVCGSILGQNTTLQSFCPVSVRLRPGATTALYRPCSPG